VFSCINKESKDIESKSYRRISSHDSWWLAGWQERFPWQRWWRWWRWRRLGRLVWRWCSQLR